MSNQRVVWLGPDDPANSFPAVSTALVEPDGLLAAGGDLSTKRLLYAYRHGIFPWYDDGQPLLWWSPDPRCVFLPGNFHVSRRLRREVRRCGAEIRINTAFRAVIRECAGPRRSEQGTWITSAMIEAFEDLHEAGWAHSVEVWQSGKLVGGLYGLAIGKAFFGESMFSLTSNASKIALIFLSNRLNAGDFEVLDCQVVSSHLLTLGASIIPRGDFIRRIESACDQPPLRQSWPDTAIPSENLLSVDD
jgi:leucyl/phenylalanyl-tRNA--protein transferase